MKELIVLFSISAVLLFAEGALRLFRPFPSLLVRDPELLYRYRGGASKEVARGDQNFTVRISPEGFRGDAPAAAVAVYGDSFIAAEYSKDTFCTQLSSLLNRPVVNAGVPGYGPDQALLKIWREIPTLKPSAILFSVFADNDLGDLIRNQLFQLDELGGLTRRYPVFSRELSNSFALTETSWQIPKLFHSAWAALALRWPPRDRDSSRFPIVRWGRGTLETKLQWNEEEFADYQNGAEIKRLLFDHYDADFALTPSTPAAQYKRALMAALFKEVARTSREENIPIIVLLIPSPIDLIDGFDGQTVDRFRYRDYHPQRYTMALQEDAERAGLAVINLYSTFKRTNTERLFFGDGDDHWNETGQRLAAETVKEFLDRQALPDLLVAQVEIPQTESSIRDRGQRVSSVTEKRKIHRTEVP